MKQINEKTFIADEGKCFMRINNKSEIGKPYGNYKFLVLREILIDSNGNLLDKLILDNI